MRYTSTRSSLSLSFSDILIKGLAPDGGLMVPADNIPHFSYAELESLRHLSYPDLAFRILQYFVDIPPVEMQKMIKEVYRSPMFRTPEITPIKPLFPVSPHLFLLGLSEGPTLAFKDIAMQWLGPLFEQVLREHQQTLNILGATSGDTGSAAEYALRRRQGIKVFMLSPDGRMSAFQRAQMYTLDEPNIFNIAITGVFDDCQNLVKEVTQDASFKKTYHLGAINSINWGRIIAQTVYYFKAYFATTKNSHEHVSFTVPSGNFGNIYAGYLTKQMGLPIHRLVLATNENNVLDDFFRTGVYKTRGSSETKATSSPSMDISKASNLERFIYDITGHKPEIVKGLWQQIDRNGAFDLSTTPYYSALRNSGIVSGTSTHQDRLNSIRSVYKSTGTIIDPHTADGITVALKYPEKDIPMIVLETALPEKFAETIQEALGKTPPRSPIQDKLEQKPLRYDTLPISADALKTYIAERA